MTATVAPGEAISWLAEQSPATRRVLAERFEHIAAWWQGMAAHARLAGATSGSAVLQREEVVARGPHEA
ncbi:MAG TPA: hypothetical protein VK457_23910 [Chloroflexota bacterium]|nr:hypothetical protein [Chloroflexota bacterium]